jgi:hypothetical protein
LTEETTQTEDELTSEDIIKLANSMKDNAPVQDEKQNVHTFLHSVVVAEDTRKVGNLKDDDKLSELGLPSHTVRGSFEMARISREIMDNDFFANWFNQEAEETLATSLSRGGFLVRQATVQTKNVADVTKRKKINKGWFRKTEEETGGFPDKEG